MIAHWLHADPAESMEEWAAQVTQAAWLERRYFETMSKIFHGKGK